MKTLHEALSDEGVAPADRAALAASWDEILGLDLSRRDELSAELERLIAQREDARRNRDFATADSIRDRLRSEGIELLDSAEGTSWVRR